MPELTQELLKSLLHYDPATGIFTWLVQRGGKKRGAVAGCIVTIKYRYIGIERGSYLASRLAYLWMTGAWPLEQMDHINGVRGDDRWVNLRNVSSAVNKQNCRHARKHNRTGFLGVEQRDSKFVAKIFLNGKCIQLGRFLTAEAAHAAYVAAKRRLHPGNML